MIFPFAVPPRSRLWCALAGCALAAVAVLFLPGVFFVGTWLRDAGEGVVFLAAGSGAISALRLATMRRPVLRLGSPEVEIRHPGLLSGPVILPVSEVRAVLVSDALIRRRLLESTLPPQFALEPTEGQVVFVYPGGRRLIPALGFYQQSMNLCLLFTAPVAMRVRRLPALLLDNRALLRMRTVPALCLPLETPVAAREALVGLGVASSMPQAELEAMFGQLQRRNWLGR